MKSVEIVAKTKEEALELALKELNVDESRVKVEVLEETSSKSFLGLLNVNRVKIRATVKEELAQKAVRFLRELLVNMGIFAQVEMFKRPGYVVLNINGDDLGRLIGRHGQTLNALQYIVNLAVHKDSDDKDRVIIDVGGYRKRREENLKRLAQTAAERVRRKGRREVLSPMTPQERRIIHLALQNNKEVVTHSEGEEPYRRVVISPKTTR
ncbi:MAG TPA: protein jag [Firmicutes bacterium]|uniref:RNA-binding protein KhpB n=1 Tax=Capillibacterium thermochitinicola TaxID=2699427 RepID=A0A8J6HSA7_9FIRM|nr:RNA-binding cell elongation regulator Jag/EloR [Capillibacterium thermochitinicola]MBA2133221.1 protein jag [Capillibacterium thermochitinicola]HHW12203.1 protein jag [Bacillota bacterium]